MTPQELKNSILQLAIQGKLVEQRADEGTGRALLEKILAAKNAESAKGKGEKSHAKSAKSAKVGSCVSREEIPDDEKPFDIPESWEWVRLANIWSVLNGDRGKNYPSKSTLSHTGIPFISAVNLDGRSVIDDDNLLCLSDNQYEKLGNGKLICGDIVVCIRGSLGKHGRYPFEKGAIASSLVIMRSMLRIPVLDDFLMFYLDSPLFFSEIKRYDNGTAQPNLAAKSLEQFLFPLPPLVEQKRIVAKIEELMPLVERYEKAWSKLKDFNKRFPADMQKSLLQMAIQGKLVEQRAEEGTGKELLGKILAAKNAEGAKGRGNKLTRSRGVRGGCEEAGISNLPKAAKSQPSNTLSALSASPREEIPDDEKPFDIPESWEWVRLEDLVIKDIKRGKSPTYTQKSGTLVFAQKCNTKSGVINLSLALFLDEAKLSKYPESEFMRDCDIVINSTGNGTLGRVGIYRDSDNPNKLPVVPDSHVTVIRVGEKVSVEYVFYGLKHYQPLLEKLCSGSTNQTELSASTVKSLLFPLPPLAEQKRIVAKLEELLPLCERLKR